MADVRGGADGALGLGTSFALLCGGFSLSYLEGSEVPRSGRASLVLRSAVGGCGEGGPRGGAGSRCLVSLFPAQRFLPKVTWPCSLADGGTGKPHSSASPKHFQHSRDAAVEGVGRLPRREAGGSLATNRVSQTSGCESWPVSGQEETKLVISIKVTFAEFLRKLAAFRSCSSCPARCMVFSF